MRLLDNLSVCFRNALICMLLMTIYGSGISQTGSWDGRYVFSEEPVLSANGEYSAAMVWELNIQGNSAKLEVMGIQTWFVFICNVTNNNGVLEVCFGRSEGETVMAPEVVPGERLFALELKENRLITYWYALQPRLDQDAPKTGKYFTKSD